MKKHIKICGSGVVLKTIRKRDIEYCRKMKNKFLHTFFYQKIISKQEQIEWYHRYMDEENNYIFVMTKFLQKIGCIGYRIRDKTIDLYNLMANYNCEKQMKCAVDLVVRHIVEIYGEIPIGMYVLKSNYSMYVWCLRNGFNKSGESDTYYWLTIRGTL